MRRLILAMTLLGVCATKTCAQNAPTPGASQAPSAAGGSAQEASDKSVPVKNDYGNPDNWLCRPGLVTEKDACAVDLSTTVVAADGSTSVEKFTPNASAPIDCFYVYPTVSTQPTGNADMTAGPKERAVIRAQFARFASNCRPYAPLYRQATLAAIIAASTGRVLPVDRAMVYNDILDAWNYYLAHDNKGRGVVLIGHSQGAGVLTLLIKGEIDGKPVQKRIVSALLLGTNIAVPKGKEVGGRFEHMPLCRATSQTGCLITYVSFRAMQPPTPGGRFGHVPGENMEAACTNPAALGGGSGALHAYLRSGGSGFVADEATPGPWTKSGVPITTPFVSLPGLLSAECLNNEDGSYLAITVHGDPDGPRTNRITGDVVVRGQVLAEWGLHLIDVSEAMGNLLDIVGQQSAAYQASVPKK